MSVVHAAAIVSTGLCSKLHNLCHPQNLEFSHVGHIAIHMGSRRVDSTAGVILPCQLTSFLSNIYYINKSIKLVSVLTLLSLNRIFTAAYVPNILRDNSHCKYTLYLKWQLFSLSAWTAIFRGDLSIWVLPLNTNTHGYSFNFTFDPYEPSL